MRHRQSQSVTIRQICDPGGKLRLWVAKKLWCRSLDRENVATRDVARWDYPDGGGITKQVDCFAELDAMVRDAVEGYFADRETLRGLRLHFVDDPVLVVA